VATFSFCPITRRSSFFPLNWNEEVRAATCKPCILTRLLSNSSARPSEKYSWSFSGLKSTKGRTAMEGVMCAVSGTFFVRASQKAATSSSTVTTPAAAAMGFQ
jgi:hypothetical protein